MIDNDLDVELLDSTNSGYFEDELEDDDFEDDEFEDDEFEDDEFEDAAPDFTTLFNPSFDNATRLDESQDEVGDNEAYELGEDYAFGDENVVEDMDFSTGIDVEGDIDFPIETTPILANRSVTIATNENIDNLEAYQEPTEEVVKEASVFDANGDIVVMDTSGDAFHLAYIDIGDIVVTDRIRKVTTVEALKTSIKKTGLLKPIVVANTATEGTYVLIDGYKRLLACAKCGLTRIPCIVNNKVKTTELSIVEALYNHYTAYNVQEMIDYIEYLEKEKGILNQSTIELLLQMEPGHYPKLKDILNDNDPAIVDKLLDGSFSIDQAFNKLKSKRAKQSKEEKELQKADAAYNNVDESEKTALDTAGDLGTGVELTDQEIADLGVAPNLLDVSDKSVEELLKEGDNINGFEDKVQKVGEREYIDPAMRKAVMARDNNTCQCCQEGGESYVDVNDFHHILPVFLGGPDTVDNAVCLCVKCHKLVHLHARGQLHLPTMETLSEADKEKFKLIISYGNYIRKGMERKGMKLDDYKKKDSINKIGRQMPGTKNTVS